jgi:ADP-heptose:LPS heptosyltransferase
MNKEKILLIQLFSNGDCLYVTAIVRYIKQKNPSSYITWVVSTKCKNMLINNPDIDEIEEVTIQDTSKNEEVFNRVLKDAHQKMKSGLYSEVIVPQLLGSNMKYYDGIVCSSLFRSAGLGNNELAPPRLYLMPQEIATAQKFAEQHQLSNYQHIVLFECAPQTNQLLLTDELILAYSKKIIEQGNACVILSAPKAYHFNAPHIFDGNTLSIRETVALTHHCTILLGCSSGISWAATSNAAKPLQFVQILAPDAYYFNPLSITLKKWQQPLDRLIELVRFDVLKIGEVFRDIFSKDFDSAKAMHNQPVQVQFRLHRGIVHGFLKKGRLSEIITFVKTNIEANGWSPNMLKYISLGILLFPFQLISDQFKKN